MDGLQQLTTVEQIARERGVEPAEIGYRSRAEVRTERVRAGTAAVEAI